MRKDGEERGGTMRGGEAVRERVRTEKSAGCTMRKDGEERGGTMRAVRRRGRARGTAKAYTPQAANGEREQCKQRRRAKQLRLGGKIMRYAPQTRSLCWLRGLRQEFSEIKL